VTTATRSVRPSRRSVLFAGAGLAARLLIPVAPAVTLLAAGCAAASPLRARVKVGSYVHLQDSPAEDPVAPADVDALEGMLGHRFDIIHYFFTWGRSFGEALNATSNDHDLLLSLKPDGNIVREVIDGVHDGYLEQFARDVRDFGRVVYLRYGHEMNGSWMSYSAGADGGPSADQFVQSWRHLVAVFRRVGATNARFVWCVNEMDVPDRPGNRMEDYWPGKESVDIIGFDAYNWSYREPKRGNGSYRTFAEITDAPYRRVAALTNDRPVWLCEFGTTDPVIPPDPSGSTKGGWFRDMFASTSFPRLEAIVYFSKDDQGETMRDWRLDSSADSIAGFRQGWAGA
jgi:beta-mannanase